MMTHGGTGARGLTETDSDTVTYRCLVLAGRGTHVVWRARLTSAIPAHKAAPAVIATSPRGLITKEHYLPHD
jgi:hypothetical protein